MNEIVVALILIWGFSCITLWIVGYLRFIMKRLDEVNERYKK